MVTTGYTLIRDSVYPRQCIHRHCIKRFTQSIVPTMCTYCLHKTSWQCVLTIYTGIATFNTIHRYDNLQPNDFSRNSVCKTIYTGIVSKSLYHLSSRQCALTVYTRRLDNVSHQFTKALHTCGLHNVSGSRSSRDLGPGDNWQDFQSVYVFSSWARRIRSHGYKSRSWNKTEEAYRVHRAVGHHLNCPTPELTCIFNSCGKFTKFLNFSLLHI